MKSIYKLYNLLILSCLFYAIGGTAKIPFQAFKDITLHFYEDTQHYSPTLGVPAIESGFIENLRFYVANRAFKSDGSRDYARDKALESDPVSNLVIKLFPSTAGQLSTLSEHPSNFGRRLKSPETIAKFLNFIFWLERDQIFNRDFYVKEIAETLEQKHFDMDQLTQQLNNEIDSLLKEAQKQGKSQEALIKSKNDLQIFIDKTFKEKHPEIFGALSHQIKQGKFLSFNNDNTLEKIFTNAKNSLKNTFEKKVNGIIDNEKKQLKQMVGELANIIEQEFIKQKNNQSYYPSYVLPQIFSALFFQHFNTKEDIKILLMHLDENILKKESVFSFNSEDLIKESDLDLISQKERLDMDDILALLTSDIWFSFTPYRSGSSLLSNGRAFPFNRADGTFSVHNSFADCAEMALRHICNLMFYDKSTRRWDLTHLDDQDENPHFLRLRDFYKNHAVHVANAGDSITRSEWNKVVGDLNHNDPNGKKIEYRHDTYEIKSNFTNLINIFAKLLALDVGKAEKNSEDSEIWIARSLESIFKKMNPNYNYEIHAGKIDQVKGDLVGTVEIKVKINHDIVFQFNLYAQGCHTAIEDFRTNKKEINFSKDVIKSINEVTESFLLLSEMKVYKKKVSSPVLNLIGHSFQDNNRKIEVIKSISDSASNDLLLPLLEILLNNIFQDMQFHNLSEFEKILPSLINLLLYNEKMSNTSSAMIKNIVNDNITAISFLRYLNELSLAHDLNNDKLNQCLQSLISVVNKEDEDFDEVMELMSKLYFKGVFKDGFDQVFKEVTSLKLSERMRTVIPTEYFQHLTNLKDLTFFICNCLSGNQFFPYYWSDLFWTKLERIYLNGISSYKDLKLPPSVEKIKLQNMFNLTSVNFADLKEVRNIFLENLTSIDALSLREMPKIQELTLKKCGSITEISLSNLPHLRNLLIEDLPSMTELTMHELPSLKTCNLINTDSLQLMGLKELINLRELNISYSSTHGKFKEINIKNMSALERLSICNANISQIIFGEKNNLEEICLENVYMPTALNVQHLQGLKWLCVKSSPKLQLSGTQFLPRDTKISINEESEDNEDGWEFGEL